MAANETAHVDRMIQTEMVAAANDVGFTRLDVCPSGGFPAGIAQRSTPGGIEAMIGDQMKSIFN